MSKNRAALFQLDGHIEDVTRSMNRVAYQTLVSMIFRVDEVSPVGDIRLWKNPGKAPKGYRGGQFRGNWQLGVDQVPGGWFKGKIDPSGESTVAANIGKIPTHASRHKYALVNNVPYALALDQGHSSQMPAHMTTRIRREIPRMIRDVIAEVKQSGARVR